VPPGSPFYDMLMTGKAPSALPVVEETGLKMTNGGELALSAAMQAQADLALVRGMTGAAP
jgi:hypothetical protein